MKQKLLCAAVAALALTALPAVSHAAAVGIADGDPETFVLDPTAVPLVPNPKWENVDVRFARAIFPYDVALRPAGIGERDRLEKWLNALRATGTGANVSFRDNGHIPNEAEFKQAFQAFIDIYGPGTAWNVTLIGPWNEPNYTGIQAKTHNGRYLWDPACPSSGATVDNCMPRLAAYYWRWANSICVNKGVGCTLAAGEFAGSRSSANAAYVEHYKTHLSTHRPELFAVHTYTDVKDYQHHGDNTARETRWFIDRILNDSRFSSTAHMWISATGAFYDDAKDTNGDGVEDLVHFGERSQCDATAFIQRLPNLDSRITRLYYYTHYDGSGMEETGLLDDVNGTSSPRTARERLAYWNIKYRESLCSGRTS